MTLLTASAYPRSVTGPGGPGGRLAPARPEPATGPGQRRASRAIPGAPGDAYLRRALDLAEHARSAPGTSRTGRAAGPTYRALGRTSLPARFCSRMCAAHPAVRAQVNIEVNMLAGTSAKSRTIGGPELHVGLEHPVGLAARAAPPAPRSPAPGPPRSGGRPVPWRSGAARGRAGPRPGTRGARSPSAGRPGRAAASRRRPRRRSARPPRPCAAPARARRRAAARTWRRPRRTSPPPRRRRSRR